MTKVNENVDFDYTEIECLNNAGLSVQVSTMYEDDLHGNKEPIENVVVLAAEDKQGEHEVFVPLDIEQAYNLINTLKEAVRAIEDVSLIVNERTDNEPF